MDAVHEHRFFAANILTFSNCFQEFRITGVVFIWSHWFVPTTLFVKQNRYCASPWCEYIFKWLCCLNFLYVARNSLINILVYFYFLHVSKNYNYLSSMTCVWILCSVINENRNVYFALNIVFFYFLFLFLNKHNTGEWLTEYFRLLDTTCLPSVSRFFSNVAEPIRWLEHSSIRYLSSSLPDPTAQLYIESDFFCCFPAFINLFSAINSA